MILLGEKKENNLKISVISLIIYIFLFLFIITLTAILIIQPPYFQFFSFKLLNTNN
mgnify:CR=1 FL=1